MSVIFESKSVFFTKLLMSGILFLTAVNAELVVKPLTFYFSNFSIIICFLTSSLVSGIFLSSLLNFFSKSDLSVSYLVFQLNPLASVLLTFATNSSYTVFLTT